MGKTAFKKLMILGIIIVVGLVITNFSPAQTQTNTSTAWCHTFNTDLSYTDSGEEVSALQTALQKEGFYISAYDKTNKYFGAFTSAAVVGFQQKYQNEILTPLNLKYGTGIVGEKTRTKLNQLYQCQAETKSTIRRARGIFKGKEVEFVEGEILVKFKNESASKVIKVSDGTVIQKVQEYLQKSDIEYAQPNFIYTGAMVPKDILYPNQWHLQSCQKGGIDMEKAWDVPIINSVTVAVVDTGVAYERYVNYCTTPYSCSNYEQLPDLNKTCFKSNNAYDFVNLDTHPNDDNGHGTFVAGVIAQSTNNPDVYGNYTETYGVAGVAPNICILPIKVSDQNNLSSSYLVVKGILQAVSAGADIINVSIMSTTPGSLANDTDMITAIKTAYVSGKLVVFASGNQGVPVDSFFGEADDYCLVVGATTQNKTRWSGSNYGSNLDLVAPGENILQQTFICQYPWAIDWCIVNDYRSGTSAAAPQVSAAAALLLATGKVDKNMANKPFLVDTLMRTLKDTAIDLGPPDFDKEYGNGLLNVAAALGLPSDCGCTVNEDCPEGKTYYNTGDMSVPKQVCCQGKCVNPLEMSSCPVSATSKSPILKKAEGILDGKKIQFVDAEIRVKYKGEANERIIKVPEGQVIQKVLEWRKKQETDKSIQYVEPSTLQKYDMVPKDPNYKYQWHLQSRDKGGINMPPAWDITTGKNSVIVAMVDSGINRVPDLTNTCILPGYNAVNGTNLTNDNCVSYNESGHIDYVGHGTLTAGIVAQSTNNIYKDKPFGEAGIAPNVCLMPVVDSVEGCLAKIPSVVAGIKWAVDHGANIIVFFIGIHPDQGLIDAIEYAYNHGVLVVGTASNDNSRISNAYGSADQHMLLVGATKMDKTKASYSNYGLAVDLFAPGGEYEDVNNDGYADAILQQTWALCPSFYPGSNNCYQDVAQAGTCSSAPQVAAVAALLLSAGKINKNVQAPYEIPDQIMKIIKESAYSLGDRTTYGAGLLDAYGALTYQPKTCSSSSNCTSGQICCGGVCSKPDCTVENQSVDCDDKISCTKDVCVIPEGKSCSSAYCQNIPDDTLCGQGEACSTDTGCTKITCYNNKDCEKYGYSQDCVECISAGTTKSECFAFTSDTSGTIYCGGNYENFCCSGVCSPPGCTKNEECGGTNSCLYQCKNPGVCTGTCSTFSTPITSCKSGDGCCPANNVCSSYADTDCPKILCWSGANKYLLQDSGPNINKFCKCASASLIISGNKAGYYGYKGYKIVTGDQSGYYYYDASNNGSFKTYKGYGPVVNTVTCPQGDSHYTSNSYYY